MITFNTETPAPGEILKEQREQAGFSRQYVAEQLRISAAYVEALEKNDIAKLPAMPYVIGYLRGYARLLGLDGDRLVARYQSNNQQLAAEAEATGAARKQPAGQQKWLVPLAVVAVVLVWGVSASLLNRQQAPVIASAPAPQTGAPYDVSEEASAVDLSTEELSTEELSTEGLAIEESAAGDLAVESPVADATTASEWAASGQVDEAAPAQPLVATEADAAMKADAEPQADSAPAAVAALPDTLTLVFSSDCWLQVTDARGDVLAARLYQGSQTVKLRGRAPFAVMLGNARAATVELNGVAVDLPVKPGRNSLRLQVGAAAN